MPESRMNEVAQELSSQSKDGKVSWEDAGRRASYRVFFPDVVLVISRMQPSLEEGSDLQLELMSDTGSVIDSLDTTPEETMHLVLSEIFDLAEQHVRDIGINKALDYLKRT
tara:strand:- start:149 stop:481 length:333 start_codon:yes stop_codon:yes gene_type:complete